MRIRSSSSRKNTNGKEKLLKHGAELMGQHKYTDAVEFYRNSIKKFPTEPILHYCLGVALHQANQIHEAVVAYSNALVLNPNISEAFENLAEAQTELRLFDDALISIRAALAINPTKVAIHARLAQVLTNQGHYTSAIDVISEAIKINSNEAILYYMRSYAHKGLNQLKESIADLRIAIALEPTNSIFSYNLSFDLLLDAQFNEGWKHYESRFNTKNFIESTPCMISPIWDGEKSLDGKTILVCPEQGLGDQIQFGRYALILNSLGAKVIMTVAPPLVSIMQSLHPDIFVTSSLQAASELPDHDYYIPLMSLMGIFKTNLSNIPNGERYITPNQDIANKWSQRVSSKSKLKVGITWSGSQTHVNDHNRSMSLDKLRPLLGLDVDWHVLQTEIRPADEAILKQTHLKDWRTELTSMHETAGLLDQLDLLITVDTSVAHLSAALGKPTWIMLPYAPDFRWLLNRTDSPWYPSVKLFRQSSPGCWNDVIDQIYTTLVEVKNEL